MSDVNMLLRQVKSLREWQQAPRAGQRPGVAAETVRVVALSREAGTPASEVAAALGARLGWTVYDREMVVRVAQDLGVDVRQAEWLDERHRSWLLECVESFAVTPSVTETKYTHRLVRTIAELAAQGHCVLVGRGAPLVVPAQAALRVRLTGARDDRALVWSRRHQVDFDEAVRRIAAVDRERAAYVRSHFHKDPADPHNYDLVLNSSAWSVAQCAEVIVDALRVKGKSGHGQRPAFA